MLRIFLLSLIMLGCASQSNQVPQAIPDVPDSEYKETLNKFSRHTQEYSGFHQTFGVNITLLNSAVNMMVLQRKGHFLGWEAERARQEREKAFQEMSSYSKAFISFYSPENDYDDLNKANSIWNIYLEVNGQRYKGEVKKDKSKFAELIKLFPYVDRFRTPYIVTFEVPMSVVEQHTSTVTLTSSLGTASFEFPPVGPR